ncbi:MAG: tetratricopeptide repeat protein [Verrucomicrobiota bacterium]
MKSSASSISFLGRACAVSLFLMLPAAGQGTTLESLVAQSRSAMTAKDWQRALDLNAQAIGEYGGADAFRRYGAQFGVIYYRKGLCEMKLGRWQDAMVSFETCYREFPNEGAANGNAYQKMALRKRAESAMGAGEWQLAIECFAKFLAERDKAKDSFPQGSFYINLAVCHYKLGNIAQGSENLEIAIRNKRNFPTPDTGIVAGFQSLVSATLAAGDEQALLDFIRKNRGALRIEPYELHAFSPVFMKLAGDALATGMRRAALELYQLIPSTDVAIDDVRARLRAMGNAATLKDGTVTLNRKTLEADLATFEADRRGKRATETIKLAAVAYLHEASGNFLGAYAAYLQLERWFPQTEQREENLFNLVRVAARVGLGEPSRAHAATFMKDFPNSRHLPEAREIVLSTFLDGSDSAACVAAVEPMLATLKAGTREHEICLYLLAVADFRMGAYDKAQPLLDQLATLYPKSAYAVEVAYLQASVAARRQQWEKAAGLFDAFLAAHPETPWLATALHERAICDYEAGRFDAARERAQQVISRFPEDSLLGRFYQLLGSIGARTGKMAEAEQAWTQALGLAEQNADRALAGELLCALVELTNDQNAARLKQAVAQADLFWKTYADGSPSRVRMAIAQVPALVAADRGADAVQRIEGIFAAGVGNAADQAALIDAYARAFLASHRADELAKRFENFPGISAEDKPLQVRRRMAVIHAFENEAQNAPDEARREAAAATLGTLYQQLKTGFAPTDLDAAALVRLGDHLRLKTSTPREALALYDEVLRREDKHWRVAALLGRADILARSGDAADSALGIAAFREASSSTGDAAEKSYAIFRTVETLMAQGDFPNAAADAKAFLTSDLGQSSPFMSQVALLLARSDQELGRTAEAMDRYRSLWSNPSAELRISAAAMLAWMRLLWMRDTGSDRQNAYDQALAYLAEKRATAATLNDEDLAAWRSIEQEVKTFASSPGIVSTTHPATDP